MNYNNITIQLQFLQLLQFYTGQNLNSLSIAQFGLTAPNIKVWCQHLFLIFSSGHNSVVTASDHQLGHLGSTHTKTCINCW